MAGHCVYPRDHPLMRDPARIRGHARFALVHAAANIESMRRQAASGDGPSAHEWQLIVHEVVRDLELRLGDLEEQYVGFATKASTELATAWQRFFDRYDDFLEELRRSRSEIARARALRPLNG